MSALPPGYKLPPIRKRSEAPSSVHCSFCGRDDETCGDIIVQAQAAICVDCAERVAEEFCRPRHHPGPRRISRDALLATVA
jgi:hypothetical protein